MGTQSPMRENENYRTRRRKWKRGGEKIKKRKEIEGHEEVQKWDEFMTWMNGKRSR